jgi:hypothetical protein
MMKLLGFFMVALPGIAGFAAYGMSQEKGLSPLASAALAGAAFAAAEIGGNMLSGGLAGLSMEQVGALALNPQPQSWAALNAAQRGNMGYLSPERIAACYGTC